MQSTVEKMLVGLFLRPGNTLGTDIVGPASVPELSNHDMYIW